MLLLVRVYIDIIQGYFNPRRFFSFSFRRTMSIFLSFQLLFLSLMGRFPTYLPAMEKILIMYFYKFYISL
jgi:hypothetical protein